MKANPDFEFSTEYIQSFYQNLDNEINITLLLNDLFACDVRTLITVKTNFDDPLMTQLMTIALNSKDDNDIMYNSFLSMENISEDKNEIVQNYDFNNLIQKNNAIRVVNTSKKSDDFKNESEYLNYLFLD